MSTTQDTDGEEPTTEELKARIEALEARVPGGGVKRRDVLAGLLGLGVGAGAMGGATGGVAAAGGTGSAGAAGDKLKTVYTGELSGDGAAIDVADSLDMQSNTITSSGAAVKFGNAIDTQGNNIDAQTLSNVIYKGSGETVQNAVDRAETAGGGMVYIPQGFYSEHVDVPSKVYLVGAGYHSDPNLDQEATTIKRPASYDGPVVTFTDATNGDPHSCGIANMNVVGNKSAGGVTANGNGIQINSDTSDAERVFVSNVAVWNCVDVGVKANSGIAHRFFNVTSRGNDGDGFFLSATSDSDLIACEAGSNGRHGVLITGDSNAILGGESFLNVSDGIRITGERNRVVGARGNNNNQSGIRLLSGANYTAISGCTTPNNGTSGGTATNNVGINVVDSSNCAITGCVAFDDRSGASREQDYGLLESGTSDANVIYGNQLYNNITADHSLTGATSVINGAGTEDLGVSPTSAPAGDFPEGTIVRNSNAGNNETWALIRGSWVQLA